MPMMNVGVVYVRMDQNIMPVCMRMRFATIPGERHGVLMMRVMPMGMRVRKRLMSMLVLVSLP